MLIYLIYIFLLINIRMTSMLQDLIEFAKEKEPEKPKEEKGKHPLSFPDGDRIQTQTSISNAVGIAEKIRQQKEQEEARRKAIEKFLPKKKKKINLEKFLKRNLDHEQKKQYDIEVMRNKYRDEERKMFQDKPELNKTTIKIVQTLNIPPIHLRTNDEINKRKATIEALKKTYTQREDNNNQLTTIGNIATKRNRTEISSNSNTERFNTWITQQNEWSKKIMKKKMVRSASLEEQKKKTLQDDISNNPQMSQRSAILLKKTNRKSSFDRLTTKTESSTFNKEILTMEHMPTFTPRINKNKFVNVKPRYYPDLTSHNMTTTNIIKQNRIKRKNKAKSVDRRKKGNNEKDVMEVGHVRKTESVDHWSTTLLKMGKAKTNVNYVPVEVLYKLNIMHAGAWNENDVNNVPLQGESKNIIKAFI